MGKQRVKWQPGDEFLVPLLDGTYGQGQILLHEPDAMDSVICAFFSIRHQGVPAQLDTPPQESLLAVLFVTRDLLDSGCWRIVNNGQTIPWRIYLDFSEMQKKRFIGTKIIGSSNAASLLNAFHRLAPWNGFHTPDYLDKLLISADRRPANPLLK